MNDYSTNKRQGCANCDWYNPVSFAYVGGDWWCVNPDATQFFRKIRKPDNLCDCHELCLEVKERMRHEH